MVVVDVTYVYRRSIQCHMVRDHSHIRHEDLLFSLRSILSHSPLNET